MHCKIVNIAGRYVGTLKVRGETGGYYAHASTREEVIDILFSRYWQYKTLI